MKTIDIIRQYCASKGVDAAGLSCLEAIRAQLAAENGWVLPQVEECNTVTVAVLDLKDVIAANPMHYQRVEAREMSAPAGTPLIAGVVLDEGSYYRLIDGYHRLKGLNDKGVGQATYVILSNA